jgi:RsiW-degrading membrane proteinase PrsW (M82 family)
MAPESHSVYDEPQFRGDSFVGDPADAPAPQEKHDLPVGQGAWDEPALSQDLAGERPAHVQTYAQWLATNVASFSWAKSWGITLALALGSGLWAVVGAMLSQVQSNSAGSILLIVVFGPLAEEMLKASAALIAIEKWPYVFRSPAQIVFCCIAAAFGFAVLENLLYLRLYISEPTSFVIWWRWTVCLLLHTGCSTIASMGLVRIWRQTMATETQPRVALGTPYFITAATVHGVYNFIAVLTNPFFAQL